MVAVLKPGDTGLRPMLEADLDAVIAIENRQTPKKMNTCRS